MALSAETIAFLKSTPLFSRLSDDLLAEMSQFATEVSFKPKEYLIRQDGLSDNLFIIIDGRVGIEIEDVSKIGERGPRTVVGELAMIMQTPRNANCTAVTNVRAVQFKHNIFWPFVEREASLAIGLLTEVIYHLDETIDTLYWMSKEVRELQAVLANLK